MSAITTYNGLSGAGVTAEIAAALANLTTKNAVRVATTANVVIATALNNGDSLNGVTLATGDRVLVWFQSAPAENGIYVVGASPARATDADTWAELAGMVVKVNAGTLYADHIFQCTNNPDTGTLGSTAVVIEDITLKLVQATESVFGTVRLATNLEAVTGTATDRVITPANLAFKFANAGNIVGDTLTLSIQGAVGTSVTQGGFTLLSGNTNFGTVLKSSASSEVQVTFKDPVSFGDNLTNNVTSGGVDNVIDTFTSSVSTANTGTDLVDIGTVPNINDVNSALFTIRNDIYQLARSLKLIQDLMRAMNLGQ